jgi:hypothetical protein
MMPLLRLFLQEPQGVTSQKTAFFIDPAVKNANFINASIHHFTHTKLNFRAISLFHEQREGYREF